MNLSEHNLLELWESEKNAAIAYTIKELKALAIDSFIWGDSEKGDILDVRLAVDYNDLSEAFVYSVKFGDASYDIYHSAYCAADVITYLMGDADITEVTDCLVNDIAFQISEHQV